MTFDAFLHQLPDADPQETGEWLESLDALVASEGTVHSGKKNRWHMETLHRLAAADPEFILATPFLEIDLANEAELHGACEWWEALTGKGGEGMVVKPLDFKSAPSSDNKRVMPKSTSITSSVMPVSSKNMLLGFRSR